MYKRKEAKELRNLHATKSSADFLGNVHRRDEDRTDVIRADERYVTSATDRGEGPRGPAPGERAPWAGDRSATEAMFRTNTHDAYARGGIHPEREPARAERGRTCTLRWL